MKKIVLNFLAMGLLALSHNSFAQDQPSSTVNLLIECVCLVITAPEKLLGIFIEKKSPAAESFNLGYAMNAIRLGDLGGNIFERGAKKLGMNKKHAPWVGTASWNIVVLQHINQKNTPPELLVACGMYSLGVFSGALWRKKVLAPMWEHGIKSALFYTAKLARKSLHAAIA